MSRVALVVAIAALALAGYAAVVSRSSNERHRCGGGGGSSRSSIVLCISNDTPRHIGGRSCFPSRRVEGVMWWACKGPH